MACLEIQGLIAEVVVQKFVKNICSQNAAEPSQNFCSVPEGRWVRVGEYWLYTNYRTTLQEACAASWSKIVILAWQDAHKHRLAAVEVACYSGPNVFVIRWRTELSRELLAEVREKMFQPQQHAVAAK